MSSRTITPFQRDGLLFPTDEHQISSRCSFVQRGIIRDYANFSKISSPSNKYCSARNSIISFNQIFEKKVARFFKLQDYVTDTASQDELINNFEKRVTQVTDYHWIISNLAPLAESIEKFYFDGNVSSTKGIRNITNVSTRLQIINSKNRKISFHTLVQTLLNLID